ncbi:MAG: Ni/Fe-hydrogenase cytochrome b subunit [Verrucomicrobiia bacterium]
MGHLEFQKQQGKILTKSFYVLLILSLIGMALILVRYARGIGAVSNMNDGYPWGIWITYDVATGTAIACGGYALAILVYIRNRMQYHPLIRSCVLTSMFGYGLAGFSVMVDIGRPWNAYNFFVPSKWQANSAMFEVALCVMAYSTVLIIEFLPAILYSMETSRWNRLRATMERFQRWTSSHREKVLNKVEQVQTVAGWLRSKLEKVLIVFIVLGITLPTMHQSSLGSMLLIASSKLHPLWHTPFLPLLFLINCIYIGYGIAIFESIISSHAFRRPYEVHVLSGVAGIIPWLATIWLVIVVGDLAWRNQLGAVFTSGGHSLSFLVEVGMLIIGSAILMVPGSRVSPRWLFVSAALIVLGGALYRFNVYLIGFNPGNGWVYFPSMAEIMISVGIIAMELLGYQIFVKLVPVLPKVAEHASPSAGALTTAPSPAQLRPA